MNNEEKYHQYLKRKILKYVVLVLSLATIILESFALFGMISFLWGLLTFAILYVVKYFYLGKDVQKKKDNQRRKK